MYMYVYVVFCCQLCCWLGFVTNEYDLPVSSFNECGFAAAAQVTKLEDDGELDWPAEMIESTQQSTPALVYSCNPLVFDFGLLTGKPKPKLAAVATTGKKPSDKKKKHKKHRQKSKAKVRVWFLNAL